jgi:cardiolipin synthase
MHPWHVILIAVELAALMLIPAILVSRKEPVSTFAWILTLVFLPVLGALLFLLFGREHLRMGPIPSPLPPPPAPGAASCRLVEDSLRIAQAVTHLPATTGNRCELLLDGDATYAALGAAIDAATATIEAEYYLVRADAIGTWFRERLVAAAARGVQVRLLIDGFGSLRLGPFWLAPLRRAGVRVARFSPLWRLVRDSPNLRNHRKIVVVDGRIAFTGGLNISALHSERWSGAAAWRDVHARIEGPAVAQLHQVLARDWRHVTGEALSIALPPSCPGAARLAVVAGGPDTHLDAIHRVFFTAIAEARSSIRITSPYFCPDEAILLALELAALRGVAVEMVLPARSNHPLAFHAGRSCYDRLLEAGVVIAEYQPGMIHAKTLVVDARLALIGSSNMDLRSFRLNLEVHLLVEDAVTVAALGAIIDGSRARSLPIALAAWRARGLGLRLCEGAARLLSPLL